MNVFNIILLLRANTLEYLIKVTYTIRTLGRKVSEGNGKDGLGT